MAPGKGKAAWDIYAEELSSKGHGIPLWSPEPHQDREVQIGDVGLIQSGEFQSIFNACSGKAYWDSLYGLDEITPFSYNKHIVSEKPRWVQAGSTMFSAGFTSTAAGGDISA